MSKTTLYIIILVLFIIGVILIVQKNRGKFPFKPTSKKTDDIIKKQAPVHAVYQPVRHTAPPAPPVSNPTVPVTQQTATIVAPVAIYEPNGLTDQDLYLSALDKAKAYISDRSDLSLIQKNALTYYITRIKDPYSTEKRTIAPIGQNPVYFVLGGVRFYITSPSDFQNIFGKPVYIQFRLSEADVNAIPQGINLTPSNYKDIFNHVWIDDFKKYLLNNSLTSGKSMTGMILEYCNNMFKLTYNIESPLKIENLVGY